MGTSLNRCALAQTSGGAPSGHAQAATVSTAAPDPRLQKRYQTLTRKHAKRTFRKIFGDLTGFHFRIVWAPLGERAWNMRVIPYSATPRPSSSSDPIMKKRQLMVTLAGSPLGHTFTCNKGIRHHWNPIRIRGLVVGIACLRDIDRTPPSPVSGLSERATAQSSSNTCHAPDQADFYCAINLLQILVRFIEALDTVDLLEAELTTMTQSTAYLEQEDMRLRDKLHKVLPCVDKSDCFFKPSSRARQLVDSMLNLMHDEEAMRSASLQHIACRLQRNPAYLSTVFSRVMGIAFTDYMMELRMNKAKEMLSRPDTTIGQTATALGYSNGCSFAVAFKHHTGYAPSAWRASFEMGARASAH